MKDKLFDNIPNEQKFEILNLENLNDVETNLAEGNNIIIFDDQTAYLKDNEIKKKYTNDMSQSITTEKIITPPPLVSSAATEEIIIPPLPALPIIAPIPKPSIFDLFMQFIAFLFGGK